MLRLTFCSLTLALLCVSIAGSAQCRKEKKEYAWELSCGAGALPTFLKDRTQTVFPPVRITAERKASRVLSAGIYAGYSVADSEKPAPGTEQMVHFRHKYLTAGLRLSAHVNPRPEPWDVYGGFVAGWSQNRTRTMSGDPEWFVLHKGLKPVRNGIHLSGFMGARYALGERLGLFAEVGWCVSLLSVGLSFRV